MRISPGHPCSEADALGLVHTLLRQGLARGTFAVPQLPEVAVRIVASRESASAHELADIIKADTALTGYVLRIAASAPNRPSMPIVSLQHAVAWLGLDEVANMAFTLALQRKMLDVPGHQPKARRLWRHSLASALWSRQLALVLERETGLCYLCGLLHDIGRGVTLRAAHDLARWSGVSLSAAQYDRLLEACHRDVAACVVRSWEMPAQVVAVAACPQASADCGSACFERSIVDAAHRLADCTIEASALPTKGSLAGDAPYRDLGLCAERAATLLGSARTLNAELDRYLAP
ncbi:MAG TPA: HDOD domain-containing protein [Steroidobacteraceae bacterium]|nr:HDOD domain-containing protein [Steroidobacteraceae bacterium]